MKLRNRKTGEIIELELIQINDKYLNDHELERIYGEPITLEVLNKYCEDYEPKEPLIKDLRIRKAVWAWAEANSVKKVLYLCMENRILSILKDVYDNDYKIDFVGRIKALEKGKEYTIDELCGEEEE